jgi:MinD-like ATPase involved in chromosome partitioning or flagellar assembly
MTAATPEPDAPPEPPSGTGSGPAPTAEPALAESLWAADDTAEADPPRAVPVPVPDTLPVLSRPGRHRKQRLLRPEDYLPDRPEPPELGWQRFAFQLGVRHVKPGQRERQHRTWHRLIRRQLRSPKVIAVFSPKGGVGKSTTTVELGQVLSWVRGDLIAALDANPDSGNLVKRLPEPYSEYSALELGRDADQLARYNDMLPYLTRDNSGLCVVRSSDDAAERLGPDEYRTILGLLSRFFSVIITDLGTGVREAGFLSIIDAADAVVAVTEPTFDAAEVAMEGIEWLRRRYPGKIGAGTLVLNATESHYTHVDTGRLATEFGKHMVRVLRVPRDPHLAMGGVPQWPLLAKQTQDAYLELAAHVMDGLPDDPPDGDPV